MYMYIMYTYIESWRGLANKGSGIAFLWGTLVDVWPPKQHLKQRSSQQTGGYKTPKAGSHQQERGIMWNLNPNKVWS